jgi:hypothetical protein
MSLNSIKESLVVPSSKESSPAGDVATALSDTYISLPEDLPDESAFYSPAALCPSPLTPPAQQQARVKIGSSRSLDEPMLANALTEAVREKSYRAPPPKRSKSE